MLSSVPSGVPVGEQEYPRLRGDLSLLLEVLPPPIRKAVEEAGALTDLIEVVLDLGRPLEARFLDNVTYLEEWEIGRSELDYVTERVGRFTADNRAGIERTLHRISAIRNRQGDVVGLTCRVGRAVTGTVDIIRDVIEAGKSLLLLGPPGVGKTTLLREAARVLADDLGKRVVVVDTSNEIAGDGDVPHPGIGRARRMQVPSPELQHQVMIEAVENHMPEVILIDEIGTLQEAMAARTIAERGVQLIATAHGMTLSNLMMNPTLSDLVGGVQAVTLSDDEARRRGTQKTVLERKAPTTFDILVEIQSRDRLAVYHDIAAVADALLARALVHPEMRVRMPDGKVDTEKGTHARDPILRSEEREPSFSSEQEPAVGAGSFPSDRNSSRIVRVFPLGVSRTRLEQAIRDLGLPLQLVDKPTQSDLILGLKAQRKREPKKLLQALEQGTRVCRIKSNTLVQIKSALLRFFPDAVQTPNATGPQYRVALQESEDAIVRVQRTVKPVELTPQNSYVRRLQHELIQSHDLSSESVGKSPFRRVIVYPREG